MDAPVPLILAALAAAAALMVRSPTVRAWAMLGAVVLGPAVLFAHVADTEQVGALTDRPALLATAVGGGALVAGALAVLFHRVPAALPVLAAAALPFRVPIVVDGATVELLLPLSVVVVAGVLSHAVPVLRGRRRPGPPPRAGALEWALAVVLALYAVQATYAADPSRALETVVLSLAPFALLFVLLREVPWTPRLLRACLGVLIAVALALVALGAVETATRTLLLNPEAVATERLQESFRVGTLFYEPDLFGRFLAVVTVAVCAWMLWARRRRGVLVAALLALVLWGGLLLTVSRPSLLALLAGLAVLGALRWSVPRAAVALLAALAVGAAVLVLAPGAVGLAPGTPRSADAMASAWRARAQNGLDLFRERPALGWGAGALAREYRRAEGASVQEARSAARITPVTVAAEQGVLGLLGYLAVLACAFARLLRRARRSAAGVAIAAAFAALVVHTLLTGAFLADPLAWALLGAGSALAVPSRAVRPPDGPVAAVDQRKPVAV
jgi:O-antigen ligase